MIKINDSKSTSVWDYKPGWCQPWSIILAGIVVVGISWLVLHNVWLTTAVSCLIFAWWIYFLVLYPKAFAKYIAAQQTTIDLD